MSRQFARMRKRKSEIGTQALKRRLVREREQRARRLIWRLGMVAYRPHRRDVEAVREDAKEEVRDRYAGAEASPCPRTRAACAAPHMAPRDGGLSTTPT